MHRGVVAARPGVGEALRGRRARGSSPPAPTDDAGDERRDRGDGRAARGASSIAPARRARGRPGAVGRPARGAGGRRHRCGHILTRAPRAGQRGGQRVGASACAGTLGRRDRRRLDHRGPRAAARAVRLGAGLHVAACSRSPGSRSGAWLGTRIGPLVLSDGAHSPYAPAFGLLGALLVGALLAGLFEAFGAPVRRALAALPGFGAADGSLGAVLIAVRRASASSGSSARSRVQSGSYRMRQEVQRSAILQRLNTVLPPSGPLLNSLRRARPVPAHRRARGATSRRRARGIARDPEVAGGGRERGQGARHARAGWASRARAGSRATGSSSRTRTSSPARTTRACCSAGASRAGAAQAVHFDPRNDLAVLRVDGPRRARRCRSPASAGAGHVGGDPRLPAQRAVRRARRAALGADAAGALLRRLRPRAGRALDDRAARARALGQLGRADGRRRRPRRHDDLRRHHAAAPRGGYGVPNAVVRARARATAARRRSRPGPCARLTPAAATLRRPWARPSSSPRSRPSGATSRACCPARSRSTRATSSPTSTS